MSIMGTTSHCGLCTPAQASHPIMGILPHHRYCTSSHPIIGILVWALQTTVGITLQFGHHVLSGRAPYCGDHTPLCALHPMVGNQVT